MIKMTDDTMICLNEKGKALLAQLEAAGWNPDLVDPSFYPEDEPEMRFVNWEWFIEADKATKPGEEYPELYTSGMIADELQVSRNRVRNILDNWCVCGPVIHIGRVKLYSSETFDQVARALSQIDSMAEKEDVCDD